MSTLVEHTGHTAIRAQHWSEGGPAPRPISLPHRDGLLVRVARKLEIIYEHLGGPPQSDRDRTRHAIEVAERDHYPS